VLRIARLSERTGAYYLADLAAEVTAVELAAGAPSPAQLAGRGSAMVGRWPEPVVEPGAPGRWMGTGAEGLGLSGPVDPGGLGAVLSGRHPRSDRPLRRTETAVSGFDLTFAAPKSASLVFGLSNPATAAEATAAHSAAVDAAMGYMERRAVTVRRGSGDDRRVEPGDGVVAASFTHGASRALDPHLHTHVVVANVVHGADGRWSALDSRALFAHAAAAGALYDAHLRYELRARLGTEWSLRRSGGYELATVDAFALGAFSGRRAEIRGHLHGRAGPARARAVDAAGAPSRSQRAVAWAATRDEKPMTLDARALRRYWHERAETLGALAPTFERQANGMRLPAAGRGAGPGPVPALDEHRFAAALYAAEHRSPTRRDAVAAWAAALAPGAPVVAVERCIGLLVPDGAGVGVAEPSLRRRDLVPTPHLVRALGPRPGDPAAFGVWQGAAAAIDRYRARWSLDQSSRPLGEDAPGARARMPARRLAEHLRAEREIADARRALGRPLEREPFAPGRELGR
jgi:conjugative relaxase-like TrwC/TraI family protein